MDYGKKILAVANKEIGMAENPLGSNLGADIVKYKRVTWLDPFDAWPWCQAFVDWVIKQVIGVVPTQTAAVEGFWAYAGTDQPYFIRFRRGEKVARNGDFAVLSKDGRDFTHVTIVNGARFLGGNQGHKVQNSDYASSSIWGYVRLVDDGKDKPATPPKAPLFEVTVQEDGKTKVVAVGNRFKIGKVVAGKAIYWSKKFGGFTVRKK